jgi:hypothetical protein
MPNKKKVFGELEVKVKEFVLKGYNCKQISAMTGLARGTVKDWATNNGLKLTQRTSPEQQTIISNFIELMKSGKTLKEAKTESGIKGGISKEFIKKHGLESYARTRAEASLDKILSLDEATSRLPLNSGNVIGFEQISGKYVIKALDGFIYYKTSAKLYQGDPRGKCGTKLTEQNIIQQLAKLGYEYISNSFTIKREPLKAIHLKCGNIREAKLTNFGFQDCATCSNSGVSKVELELLSWIKQWYPSACKYKFEERITRPQEIDIYIPELKLGIEFCGLYHHRENDLDVKDANENKHYKKMLKANKLGIRLITVFENEWNDRKDQVKGFILSALHKNVNKISGRKCEVKEISLDVGRDFMEKYHIQGSDKPKFSFGLFFLDELVGVITGGYHPQMANSESDTICLNRLAFKSGTTIVGGASKLFSLFKNHAKQNGYNNILSWSDNRWSEGNVYKQLGFTFESQRDKGKGLLDGSIWPDFYYAYAGKLYTRSASKNIDITKANKVYDCGKKRWSYSLK